MFCPKCGTSNPDDGKYCRSCGVDLGNVSAVMSGNLPANITDPALVQLHNEARRRNDPSEVYAAGVRHIIWGVGFALIALALGITGVAGGKAWWWAMLFPAMTFIAKGVSGCIRYSKMETPGRVTQNYQPQFNAPRQNPGLPSTQADYVSTDDSRYKTGDLVPPSVTDNTTRHLEMNPEGETMTLPKK